MQRKSLKPRPLSCSGKIWEGSTLFRLVLCTSRGSPLALLSMEHVEERRWAGNRPKNQGTSQLESGLSCVDSLFCWKLSPRMADIVYLNVNWQHVSWPSESGFWIIHSGWLSLPLNPSISADNWTIPDFMFSHLIWCPRGIWGGVGASEMIWSCLPSFTKEPVSLTSDGDFGCHLFRASHVPVIVLRPFLELSSSVPPRFHSHNNDSHLLGMYCVPSAGPY